MSGTTLDTAVRETPVGTMAHKSGEDPIIAEELATDERDDTNKVTDVHQVYQIFEDQVLGSGAHGTVYGGVHRETGHLVAIKEIDTLKFPKRQPVLRNEVEILQAVAHPGVVRLERVFQSRERMHVVMEKMHSDLVSLVHLKGRLSERTTKFLVSQILVTLKHLHSNHVVHCDIKPDNLLISSNSDFPQIKLCDFGHSKIIKDKTFSPSQCFGTASYRAPEVLSLQICDSSLDMWSLGVTVYTSIYGYMPFEENDKEEDIKEKIQNQAWMYPTSHRISSRGVDFIKSLLQVEQSERLTAEQALEHPWLQDYQTWCDLRQLERRLNIRYVTHESDDALWENYPHGAVDSHEGAAPFETAPGGA